MMGVDAGGLAAAALAVCAAAIPDSIQLKVKRHDDWMESPRIWVALIGSPSTKKSPLIPNATAPLKKIDRALYRAYVEAKAEYDGLDKELTRLRRLQSTFGYASRTPPLRRRKKF